MEVITPKSYPNVTIPMSIYTYVKIPIVIYTYIILIICINTLRKIIATYPLHIEDVNVFKQPLQYLARRY